MLVLKYTLNCNQQTDQRARIDIPEVDVKYLIFCACVHAC